MPYVPPVDWQNFPVTATPLSAENLIAMETALAEYSISSTAFGLDVREFGSLTLDGTSSTTSVLTDALAWFNDTDQTNPVLVFPPGIYLVDDTLPDITRVGGVLMTAGYQVTTLLMDGDNDEGRFWNIDGGSTAANQIRLFPFEYSYAGVPTNGEAAIRIGKCSESEILGGAVRSAAGIVLFENSFNRITAQGFRGSMNLALGGVGFENRGGSGWKIYDNHINSGDTDGANQGGAFIRIAPGTGETADGGHIWNNEMQGANSQGPDWGIEIDMDDAKAVNNQRFVTNCFDHTCKFAIDFHATNGSVCRSRYLSILDQRTAADVTSSYRFMWESEDIAMDWVVEVPRAGIRMTNRPIFVSSAPNSLRADYKISLADNEPGDETEKIVYNFGCSKWIVEGRMAPSSDGGVGITAGGELIPYKIHRLVVDANGGTFTLTFGGQTTSALAYDISGAALQTALEALSNIAPGDVTVEGGPGGVFGPVRTRLAAPWSFGDTNMTVQDIPFGTPEPGTVKFGGTEIEVDYTTANDVTNIYGGCTGGAGTYETGQTVFNKSVDEGPGRAYMIIWKGAWAPTATTAPGFDGAGDVSTFTVNGASLTPTFGTGETGFGRGYASLDTMKFANPIDNYNPDNYLWLPLVTMDDPADPSLLPPPGGFTEGYGRKNA